MTTPPEARSQRVSVVIPHFNDTANLRVCLDRLIAQDYPRDLVEIIVADNNSRCGLAAVAEVVRADAMVILATEQGAGPARNAGVEASSGVILAFIDSDCVPEPGWIREGVAALSKADFVGGRVDVLPERAGHLSPTEAFETVFAFDFESYITRKRFTGSGNMFVTRAVFDRVGGFRKTVSEDMEWSHRALAKGYTLAFAPAAVVGHPARRNWDELTRKWRRLVAEAFAYEQSRGGSALRWGLRSLAVLASPLVHLGKVLTTPRLPSWRDRLNAAGVLVAIRAFRCVEMWKAVLRARTAPDSARQPS